MFFFSLTDQHFASPSRCSAAPVAERGLPAFAAPFQRTVAAASIAGTNAPAAARASALAFNASVQRALTSLTALAFILLPATSQPLALPAFTSPPAESLHAVLVLVTVPGFFTAAAAAAAAGKLLAAECLDAQLVIFPSACLGDGAAAAAAAALRKFPARCQDRRVLNTPAAVSGPAQNVQKHGYAAAAALARAHASRVVFVNMDQLLACFFIFISCCTAFELFLHLHVYHFIGVLHQVLLTV